MRSVNDMPTSYVEAYRALDGHDYRKIANNTWLRRDDCGSIHLGLHSTIIATWDVYNGFSDPTLPTPHNTVRLNTGGYRTVTTKARMNAALRGTGYRVFAKDYAWFISTPDGDVFAFEDGDTWPINNRGNYCERVAA